MATSRKGTLAAGAARAGGERARRHSTPLIGLEPQPTAPVAPSTQATPKAAAKGTPQTAPRTAPTTKAKATAPRAAAPAAKAARNKLATPRAATPPVAPKAPATPVRERPAHRPQPTVTSAPMPKVARQTGERRLRRPVPAPAADASTQPTAPTGDPAPVVPRVRPVRPSTPADPAYDASISATETPAPGGPTVTEGRRRVPRQSPRAKRLADDATRPRLRIAEPPLNPAAPTAPGRTGFPVPDLAELIEGFVVLLRTAAAAVGIPPEEIERRVAQVLAYLRRRLDGDYVVDDFGYDQDFTENIFYPLLRPIYRSWFRVEVRGIENIPTEGGALVVANHSGTVAIDSLMVQLAIHDEHPAKRAMRALGADLVFQTPFLGTVARRSGSTLATNTDADRLFQRGELVGVFPEGFKGVGKPFKERYKLQRFGRGGFVSAALKAQVPIIPCSVVGAEEIAPIIGNMNTVARLFGLPYAPITPTFPLLGPLGLIPLPSKWIIEFGAPIPTDTYPAGSHDDPMLVFDLTDQVRETIQQSLYTLLMQRRSVFF